MSQCKLTTFIKFKSRIRTGLYYLFMKYKWRSDIMIPNKLQSVIYDIEVNRNIN